MSQAVNTLIQDRTQIIQRHRDVIVIGGGIFGLWAARHALKRGQSALVLEKRFVGAGASGGFLGALMPHMPDTWNTKKQMQFEGLATIGDAISKLEADTGLSCGFRRCGRLMPMTHEKMIQHARARVEGARANWQHGDDGAFSMEYLPPGFSGTIAEGWLDEAVAPFGATHDTLSARVNPRAYLEALALYVHSHRHGEIMEGADVTSVVEDGDGLSVTLGDGSSLKTGQAIIANGWEAYGLLARMSGQVSGQVLSGRGVKGQAVLLEHIHDDNRPLVYDNGSYIVPHGLGMGADAHGKPNRIAVGSTSENDWMPAGMAEPVSGDPVNRSQSGAAFAADHPERPASVEPVMNRAGYDDGPLPDFSELPMLAQRAKFRGLVLASESFAGTLTPGDPLARQLLEAARKSYDEADTGFLDHARALCLPLRDAPVVERWANIRPRNTVPDPASGKIGTEPIFATLDGQERTSVAVGGFKISFGIGHLDHLQQARK